MVVNHQRKRQFKLEVRNEARLKITSALRDYQRWLNEISVQFVLLMSDYPDAEHLIILKGLEAMDTHLGWIFQLEEHEALYPETTMCKTRMMLADRAMRDKIRIPLSGLDSWDDVHRGNVGGAVVKKVLEGYQYAPGLEALSEDLRVYMQNACFGDITNYEVKTREIDPKRPHLKYNKKRRLLEVIPPAGEPTWPWLTKPF